MNEYFTPKAPEPRMGVFDIFLRALICVVAVLILGVGIWMTIDALHKEPVSDSVVVNGERTPSTNHIVVQALPE
jgi:cell division septal protein FtsQ